MAKLVQAVEHNLRQIEKLRYLNAFVTETEDYARTLLEESAQRHAEGALLMNESRVNPSTECIHFDIYSMSILQIVITICS